MGSDRCRGVAAVVGCYLIGDSAGQFVHPGSGFGNLLRSVDHI